MKRRFEIKIIRAIARNKMENRTTRNSIPMWFKNMQPMLIQKITNISG